MKAMACMTNNSFSSCSAAAGTSAPMISALMDTAIDLVVSICILPLVLVRILG